MSDKKYWVNYYNEKSLDEIPWNNTGEKLLDFLFSKHDLPKKGNVLDVGTGMGNKAITLSKVGYKVWAFDIAKEAFSKAEAKHPEITFFESDAVELDTSKEIKNVKFDIVFDILATQFLSDLEKEEYLKHLSSHLLPNSYFVLHTFYKSDDMEESNIPWIKKASQSKSDIKRIYGKYFSIEGIYEKQGKKGAVATFVMKRAN